MPDKELEQYIQKSLQRGMSIEQIKAAVNEALEKSQRTATPKKESELNIQIKSLSASQILLYLGGLIVVLAGVIYISINWFQWSSAARIFAIFLPMFICFATGSLMYSKNDLQKQGIVFVVVGSLLFPLFLSITFNQMNIFDPSSTNEFGLTVSLLSAALYLGLNFIFRFPIWAFLYHGVGLFVYYYFWRVLGIKGVFQEPTLAWLFLIPGTAYLLLSLLYERLGKKAEAGYSHMLGTIVLIFAFIRLFTETLTSEGSPYLLIIFGIAYFLLGIYFERRDFKNYSQAPYFLGTGILFFSLLRLTVDGTLLKDLAGNSEHGNRNIVGWSNVTAGVIYLLIARITSILKNFQLEGAVKFKEFFDLVGSFFTLGAIFYLGLDGKKIMYETALLLSSLGFIFGSIPTLSRQFLYVGTLFLVVYIFSMGGEYFQNDVGWPITLFVAGLLSMGIGVAIERVKRRYFVI